MKPVIIYNFTHYSGSKEKKNYWPGAMSEHKT